MLLYAKEMLNFKFKPIYALVCLLMFSTLHYFFNETLEINAREYGNFIICTLQIILGIYLVFSLASLIKTFKILSQVLAYIGVASLMILIVPCSPQHILTGIFQYHLSNYKFAVALFFLAASVVISLIVWEITLRSTWLSQLILPIRKR